MFFLKLYYLSIIIVEFLMESVANSVILLSDKQEPVPIVINTWGFANSTQKAWDTLMRRGSALDAIEIGCSTCETEQCDHTVGWGGSPDESGETTLDAMIMDGPSHDIGAVGSLRRIKNAISVARKVLENTEHTFLVGELATNFAVQMGFKEESLTSDWSKNSWIKWRENNCQPNYWKNVSPNPKLVCGPYKPTELSRKIEKQNLVDAQNHDTIGMVAIDYNGNLAVGTSTNGMIHKIPGRVGDSPIPGSGAYADQEYGGAAATGDGDVIMRFLPSYQAVENLRQGMKPTEAAEEAIKRITRKYPRAQAAIVVADIHGNYGAACIGIDGGFPFSVCNPILGNVTQQRVDCISQ